MKVLEVTLIVPVVWWLFKSNSSRIYHWVPT